MHPYSYTLEQSRFPHRRTIRAAVGGGIVLVLVGLTGAVLVWRLIVEPVCAAWISVGLGR